MKRNNLWKRAVALGLGVTLAVSTMLSGQEMKQPVYAMETISEENTINSKLKMWYTSPANIHSAETNGGEWMQQSLPLGNGNMGNLIFGGIT